MNPWTSPSHLTAVVCRDCCCGSADKHPDTDHDGHLDLVRRACAEHPNGRLVVSRCLGRCSSSNVVVVRTRQLGRPRTEVWLGDLHADSSLEALSGWIRGGGEPEQLPVELSDHVLEPRRPTRTPGPVPVPVGFSRPNGPLRGTRQRR